MTQSNEEEESKRIEEALEPWGATRIRQGIWLPGGEAFWYARIEAKERLKHDLRK